MIKPESFTERLVGIAVDVDYLQAVLKASNTENVVLNLAQNFRGTRYSADPPDLAENIRKCRHFSPTFRPDIAAVPFPRKIANSRLIS